MRKTIILFGGSGFIGRYVVRRLAAVGHQIVVPTRNQAAAQFLKSAGQVGQIILVPYPRSGGDLSKLLAGADAVVNLIGILFEKRRGDFQRVHADWPQQLALAVKQAKIQNFVQVSAIGADAQSPAAYARSKAAGEAAVLAEFPQATILRPSVVFGAEDGFLNLFAGLAALSPALPLIGGGKTRFQPVYVDDVAAAISLAATTGATQGKTYELGGPRIYSFRELLVYLLQQIQKKRCLVTLPWWIAKIQASFLQLLPQPLLTVDQVRLLQKDNVVSDKALKLRDLGIEATALKLIAPTYLARYRRGGRFAKV
jgi:uncharacterized protein YbjT (DUF2867 family)